MIAVICTVSGYWSAMRIQVHYFAVLREKQGRSDEVLEVDEGTTMAGLFEQIFGQTDLADLPVLFALNQSYVEADRRIPEGSEVSFLPPLGGG